MERFKVTTTATLTFEVDAVSEDAAREAIAMSFGAWLGQDQLAGTRFGLANPATAAMPQLMTTVITDPGNIEVEAV